MANAELNPEVLEQLRQQLPESAHEASVRLSTLVPSSMTPERQAFNDASAKFASSRANIGEVMLVTEVEMLAYIAGGAQDHAAH